MPHANEPESGGGGEQFPDPLPAPGEVGGDRDGAEGAEYTTGLAAQNTPGLAGNVDLAATGEVSTAPKDGKAPVSADVAPEEAMAGGSLSWGAASGVGPGADDLFDMPSGGGSGSVAAVSAPRQPGRPQIV